MTATDSRQSTLRRTSDGDPLARTVLGGVGSGVRARPVAWVAAAVAGLLAGIIAAALVGGGPVVWTSSATLLIDQPQALAKSSDAGVVDKLSRLRSKYVGLVFTREIAGPVAAQVHEPVQAVSTRLFATAPPQSLLIITGAQSSNRASAQHLATATAAALIEYLNHEQKAARVPAADRVVLSVVTPADHAKEQPPSNRKVLTTGIAAGIVVLLGVLLALDRRLLRLRP